MAVGHPSNAFARPRLPMTLLETLGQITHFAIRVLLALPWALTRWREMGVQLYQVFLRALPLAVVGGLALGAVIWLHAREPLRTVGGPAAVEILPRALAKVVVLELASLIAGLIVAARSGASLGAELSSMRLTEQIDALEVLGVSPMTELIAPRVLACMCGLPMLTVFVSYAAIGSGWFMEVLGGTMSSTHYRSETLRDCPISRFLCSGAILEFGNGLFGFEAVEHQVDHGQADKGLRRQHAALPVFA
jgi:phospholipid/cholesterol/gamma-HCH transport system permease protein